MDSFRSDYILSGPRRIIKAHYILSSKNKVRYGYAAAARIINYYEYNVWMWLALLYPPQALVSTGLCWISTPVVASPAGRDALACLVASCRWDVPMLLCAAIMRERTIKRRWVM